MDKAKRYYGIHFSEGIASFANTDKIGFVSSGEAISMNASMSGVPIFIGHDEASEPVGIVVKSFFNKADGKIWCEFLIFDDAAIKLLEENGWTLSNSYDYDVLEESGNYHGIDYQFQVLNGEYRHLALIEDARYTESIVLTPEEFEKYNQDLEKQTTINSNEVSMLKKFKDVIGRKTENEAEKAKAENAQTALMATKVTLPKTGKVKTINELVAEVDARDWSGCEASLTDFVHIDGIKVTIGEILAKLEEHVGDAGAVEVFKSDSVVAAPAEPVVEAASTENADDKDDKDDKKKDDKTDNDDDEDEDKEKEAEGKNKAENSNFNDLKNAHRAPVVDKKEDYKPSYSTRSARAENGRSKYGSNK